MEKIIRSALACLTLSALVGCESRRRDSARIFPSPSPTPTTAVAALPCTPVADQRNLENAHFVTDKVIAGAQPEGEASFQALRDLGVKTIITVDGARPDVEMARKYGMAYVHLPFGYDGVPAAQGMAIAKAIEEKPGPIYLHCHHGKHRSAAAAAVACVGNRTLKPEQAESVLRTFGTGANYKGLWRDARVAKPMDPAELKALKVDFAETAQLPPTAQAMVAVDAHWDHLKLTRKAGWAAPADHPDLDPAHEALQLQELLHEMRRSDSAHGRVPDYLRLLTEGEAQSAALRAALSAKPIDKAGADAAFARIAASCTACHKEHRD